MNQSLTQNNDIVIKFKLIMKTEQQMDPQRILRSRNNPLSTLMSERHFKLIVPSTPATISVNKSQTFSQSRKQQPVQQKVITKRQSKFLRSYLFQNTQTIKSPTLKSAQTRYQANHQSTTYIDFKIEPEIQDGVQRQEEVRFSQVDTFLPRKVLITSPMEKKILQKVMPGVNKNKMPITSFNLIWQERQKVKLKLSSFNSTPSPLEPQKIMKRPEQENLASQLQNLLKLSKVKASPPAIKNKPASPIIHIANFHSNLFDQYYESQMQCTQRLSQQHSVTTNQNQIVDEKRNRSQKSLISTKDQQKQVKSLVKINTSIPNKMLDSIIEANQSQSITIDEQLSKTMLPVQIKKKCYQRIMQQPIFISKSGKSQEMQRVINARCCKALSPQIIPIQFEQIQRPLQLKLNDMQQSNIQEAMQGNVKPICQNQELLESRVNPSKMHHLEYRLNEDQGQDEISYILSTKNKDSLILSNRKSLCSTAQKMNGQTVEFESCSPQSILSKENLDLNNFNVTAPQHFQPASLTQFQFTADRQPIRSLSTSTLTGFVARNKKSKSKVNCLIKNESKYKANISNLKKQKSDNYQQKQQNIIFQEPEMDQQMTVQQFNYDFSNVNLESINQFRHQLTRPKQLHNLTDNYSNNFAKFQFIPIEAIVHGPKQIKKTTQNIYTQQQNHPRVFSAASRYQQFKKRFEQTRGRTLSKNHRVLNSQNTQMITNDQISQPFTGQSIQNSPPLVCLSHLQEFQSRRFTTEIDPISVLDYAQSSDPQ